MRGKQQATAKSGMGTAEMGGAIAYHVLHAIEYALRQKGDTWSWNTIKQALQTHQVVTETDADQGKIYKKLGVDPNAIKRMVTLQNPKNFNVL